MPTECARGCLCSCTCLCAQVCGCTHPSLFPCMYLCVRRLPLCVLFPCRCRSALVSACKVNVCVCALSLTLVLVLGRQSSCLCQCVCACEHACMHARMAIAYGLEHQSSQWNSNTSGHVHLSAKQQTSILTILSSDVWVCVRVGCACVCVRSSACDSVSVCASMCP